MADPNEIIFIQHPDVATAGRSTRKALDRVWSHKGWTEVSEDEAVLAEDINNPESPNYQAPPSLSSLSKAELVDRATTAGVANPESMTKAELVQALGG